MPNHTMAEDGNLIATHYHFDAALNKEKLFKIPDRVYFNFSELSVLPKNWVQKLVKICNSENDKWLNDHFIRHLDKDYSSHQYLKEKLSLIYYRLTGELDIYLGSLTLKIRHDIVADLIEDIHECTVGFHSRVERIASSFLLLVLLMMYFIEFVNI